MKWTFAAVIVSLGALVACSSDGSSGNGGGGGEGGDDWGGNGGSGGKTTSAASASGGSGGTGGAGGSGGAGGGGSTCDNTGNCNGCQQCAQTNGGPCVDEAQAFQMSPNSQTFYSCITPCTMLPANEQQTCAQTCCMANQAACMSYGTFVNCVLCDTCYADCNGAGQGCPAP
ncbi:hypothetical protein [Polyangium jinanense]|uniref:PE-PGRS family protein n=1 Tax=Polyangium jinanense TaxID=2829994 RepID=A0A9X4AQK4_9BACT|nr:hypothetical protein [Polyangium jinanense]MDC3953777.1 hypothetical protein [Polyangium jinanense]MDC3979102.1 hypothetical protein [Polyangium jinanense]